MPSSRTVHVELTPPMAELEQSFPTLQEQQAVVIDILRASTTIIQALASGAAAVVPCLTPEEARDRASFLDPTKVLLVGERGGLKPPGFDLGNSPNDFTPARVRGKSIIMGTTNGTRAVLSVAGAKRVLVGGFVNLSALVDELAQTQDPVKIVCAGQHGEPCGEDILFAGWLVRALAALPEPFRLLEDSGTLLALSKAGNMAKEQLLAALQAEDHGMNLQNLGFAQDVEFAASLDSHSVVPQLRQNPFRLELIGPAPRN